MAEKILHVTVVSADRIVWSGEASTVIARTSEGDIGILPGHSPMLAVVVPNAVEVLALDGTREIIAVDSGFISVDHDRVSILSEYATLKQLSVADAEKLLATATKRLEDGEQDEETRKEFLRATAQVKAAHKIEATRG